MLPVREPAEGTRRRSVGDQCEQPWPQSVRRLFPAQFISGRRRTCVSNQDGSVAVVVLVLAIDVVPVADCVYA